METAVVDLVVIGQRVLVDNASIVPASVHVAKGRIVAVKAIDDVPEGVTVINAGNYLLLPGVVDTHVHVNEPGRTEWEGYWSATRSAASGGITTICDMPLNSSPPTTTLENLQKKINSAQGKLFVDVGFLGGVVPGSEEHIPALVEAGVRGFKCFMCHSGIDEFPNVTLEDLEKCLPLLKEAGAFLMYHAETPKPHDDVARDQIRSYQEFLASHVDTEPEAIVQVIELLKKHQTPAHIVHLSMAESVELVRQAKAAGLPLTAETCPHYLSLAAEDVPEGATYFKCCPPIRERANQDGLWSGLAAGALDMVVCDHSPCPPDMKKLEEGLFAKAWGGISSLQVSFVVTWTEAIKRGYSPQQIMQWMSANPAKLVGLAQKGAISVGKDADFCILDDQASWTVRGPELEHRHKLTPYEGRTVSATVRSTILRGRVIYEDGVLMPNPEGAMLLKH